MATLQSPGVQVNVIDESFYTPAAPGTVPLIFVASASNKANASGTGTAPGTLAINAGKVWTITSQRDLTDTFGTPLFYTDASGNPVHGGELNEYGLQAAYSLLGVSSKAYITRADINLSQLVPDANEPLGNPVSGTYWIDTNDSMYGVSQWDAVNKVFTNVAPLVIDNTNKDLVADLASGVWTPKVSFGLVGSYAMVVTSENTNQLWFKNTDNVWVVVGSNEELNFDVLGFTSSCWQTSWPVAISTGLGTIATTSTVSINTVSVTIPASPSVTDVVTAINTAGVAAGFGAKAVSGKVAIYADATATSNGTTADGKIAVVDGTATAIQLGLIAQTYGAVALSVQTHTQYPQYTAGKNPSGSVYVKTTAPNFGASWLVKYFNGSTQTWGTITAPIYATKAAATAAIDAAGGKNIATGTLFIESNYDHGTGANITVPKMAEFKVYRRSIVSPTTITGTYSTSTFATTGTFQIAETVAGSATFVNTATINITTGTTIADVVAAVSGAGLTNVSASYSSASGTFSITHGVGGEFKLLDGTNTPLATLGFSAYNMTTKLGTTNLYGTGAYEADGFELQASNWKPLVYEAKSSAPYSSPLDGQLWYTSVVDQVDVLVNNGTTWVGYKNYDFGSGAGLTDPAGPQIAALAPATQSDGTDLSTGDIWISTADVELYGKVIYVWDGDLLKWIQQDVTDQTTPNGWLFHDARWTTGGDVADASTIVSLLNSNYLDPDAPDPALYPQGMRLWNLRRSGFNVKKYVSNYINIYDNDGKNARFNNDPMATYVTDRWVSVSPNDADGSGSFGRHAQRSFLVKEFKSLIDTNEAIRDTDTLVFNLIACPGYPEAIQNMVAFNTDRGQTAFVVGDTPFRLKPTGTELSTWGFNLNGALDNNDVGSVSYDEYMAMFYPSGYTNDNTGNYIVVPPSHMMLRTIANSDAKSYQWFAPAGTRRGGVDNATSVGYILDGEFKPVALHEGIRDIMQSVKINPITILPGIGIVNYGQFTRARNASALDRINVARLVCYLRRQLSILARPFLFEPNDRITRNEIKAAAESLLLELVGQRALYDFIVVCDSSNNTNARIDRSELWLDIAIEPVKAVEYIYIPLRLKNTGDIKAGL